MTGRHHVKKNGCRKFGMSASWRPGSLGAKRSAATKRAVPHQDPQLWKKRKMASKHENAETANLGTSTSQQGTWFAA